MIGYTYLWVSYDLSEIEKDKDNRKINTDLKIKIALSSNE